MAPIVKPFAGATLALLAILSANAAALASECQYEVTPTDNIATALDIAIACDGGLPAAFVMRNSLGAAWAGAMSLSDGTIVEPDTARWDIPSASRGGTAHYRIALRAMAESNDSYETALAAGRSIYAAPATWLAVPADGDQNFLSIRFLLTSGGGVATALPATEGRYRIDARQVARTGPTVFGEFHRLDVPVAASSTIASRGDAPSAIDLVILDGAMEADEVALSRWVADSGTAVAQFWRKFPVERLLVVLVPVSGTSTPYGRVLSVGGITVMILVGNEIPAEKLYAEWVLIHELLHLGSPYVRDTGAWMNEGIATLYEPIIRARAGWKTREEVWREWLGWMPNGLRAMGPVGLEDAMGGGVYWGGALFLLLADIELRTRTDLAIGVEDCLRAIRDSGGTIDSTWPTDRFLAECDAATGGTTLTDLAAKHLGPGDPPDLDALWAQLGVSLAPDGTIRFDDDAPLAAVREAILDGGPNAAWKPVPVTIQ